MDYQTMPAYISAWNNQLPILALSGIHLSDRYFLLSFSRGLHNSFEPFHRYLQNEVIPYSSPLTISDPLPLSLMTD